ncbi:DUF86 domain-containing protein [Candidatus Electronema sp. PJ]|uniref:HepT-like ribonuclease domain-containing protein n=1 Tax=Candidatus Electronema sp. PJ TaxID=3401572 RepID=UPI003AA7F7B7
MYDKELVLDILKQTLEATEKITRRFEKINNVADFTNSEFGMERLDSICMLLIAIGESLKNIDKITKGELLKNYPEIDWKGTKGLRDIIAHQYFNVDAEEIFWVCEKHIPPLSETLQKMLSDLQ